MESARLGYLLVLDVEGDQRHLIGGDGLGEYDTLLVPVLLDGGGHQTAYPNAIAAHHYGLLPAVVIEEVGPQYLAVPGAQLEDVPDFDASAGDQRRRTVRAGVPLLGQGDILH